MMVSLCWGSYVYRYTRFYCTFVAVTQKLRRNLRRPITENRPLPWIFTGFESPPLHLRLAGLGKEAGVPAISPVFQQQAKCFGFSPRIEYVPARLIACVSAGITVKEARAV